MNMLTRQRRGLHLNKWATLKQVRECRKLAASLRTWVPAGITNLQFVQKNLDRSPHQLLRLQERTIIRPQVVVIEHVAGSRGRDRTQGLSGRIFRAHSAYTRRVVRITCVGPRSLAGGQLPAFKGIRPDADTSTLGAVSCAFHEGVPHSSEVLLPQQQADVFRVHPCVSHLPIVPHHLRVSICRHSTARGQELPLL